MKRILFLIFMFVSVSFCYAQDFQSVEPMDIQKEDKIKTHFGLVGGYNHSRISKFYNARHKGGFYAGAMLELVGEKNVSVQFDLVYTQMGVRLKNQETLLSPRQNDRILMNYLALSYVGKYYVEQFYLQGGFQLALLLKAKEEVDGSTTSIREISTPYDGGIILGCGYTITKNLYIDVRGYIGLQSIYKEELELVEKYNYNLSFGMGFKF